MFMVLHIKIDFLVLDSLKQAFSDKNIFLYLKELLKVFKLTPMTQTRITIFKYYLSILENLLEIDEIKNKCTSESFIFEFYSSLDKTLIESLTNYYEEFFQFLELINTLSKTFDCRLFGLNLF